MTTIDPSKSRLAAAPPPESTYLGEARYARLVSQHTRGRAAPDAVDHAFTVQRLLALEARLLDEQRFEEWLELFTAECVYWVASNWPPEDPARDVAITLDDRRRLEDRVVRYRTGHAFSQLPLSRMTRTLGHPECWWIEERSTVIARTSFHLSELRRGEVNIYGGYYEHVIADIGGQPRIDEKRVNLLVADQPVKNISFLF